MYSYEFYLFIQRYSILKFPCGIQIIKMYFANSSYNPMQILKQALSSQFLYFVLIGKYIFVVQTTRGDIPKHGFLTQQNTGVFIKPCSYWSTS